MTVVMAFDPGSTTGFARFLDGKLIETGETHLWEGVDTLVEHSDVVVYEHITVPGKAFNVDGIYVIGVIRYCAGKFDRELVRQMPSARVGAGLWFRELLDKIDSPHALDAAQHGLAFLVRRYGIETVRAQN